MSEVKNLLSSDTIFSYSVVTALIGLTWFFGVKITTMQSEINMLSSNQARYEATVEVIKQQMITKDIFNLQMENFNLKLDKALDKSNK